MLGFNIVIIVQIDQFIFQTCTSSVNSFANQSMSATISGNLIGVMSSSFCACNPKALSIANE